jgi:hypothetical protein
MVKVSSLRLILESEHFVAFNGSGDNFFRLGVKQFDKILFQNSFMGSFFNLHDVPDHKGVIFGVDVNVLRQG